MNMYICMRTTLNLDDSLVRKAKLRAAERGETLTRVIEDALRQALAGTCPTDSTFKLRWVTARGRVLPGVDLTDRDSLYERMTGTDDRG